MILKFVFDAKQHKAEVSKKILELKLNHTMRSWMASETLILDLFASLRSWST